MIVKELVRGLKSCAGNYPVVLMKGNQKVQLGREFHNDGSDWEQFSLVLQKPQLLDTEFLKHILDYCAQQETRSLFYDETPFEEFEVLASKQISEGVYSMVKILKCNTEKVDDEEVFALYVEKMFEEKSNEADKT